MSGVRDLATTFDIAARSILETQAGAGTVQSVLADRALDHQWEGLFQYAAARVGLRPAAQLLVELERAVEQEEKGALFGAHAEAHASSDAEVRPRAVLFARLRAALKSVPAQPLAPDSSLFWPVPEPTRASYVKLRAAFSAYEREIVELRFARRLSDEDVAQVLELDLGEVKRVGIVALGLARRVFPRRAPSRDRTYEGVLLEAFVLDPELCRAPRRSARRPVLELGHVVAGRYEVEALLGAGAFADVYRARDCVVTPHQVARKNLRTRAPPQRAVQAALRELEVIASVFHPSIVQLNDHGWHDGHLWFVMPLYRGETLATRLTRGPLSRSEARAVFEPLAEALAAMHRAGVQHQDVKPENVFLADLASSPAEPRTSGDDAIEGALPGRVLPVLLDLGVASKDAELVLAGTPAYFAPEVAARFLGVPDPPPVGPKADVFSLALTLRRALDPSSREHIPGGAVDAFVSYRALHGAEPPAQRELRDLAPFFARWLALKPDERPSADQLRRELAVLTRPAEQRARRLAVLRWVIPVSFAVLAMFAAVVYVLSHEASLQRYEAAQAREHAERARERAASIYASLTEQEARRKQLEQDVARLEEQYQTSRLTRDELATRLAQTEGELAVLSERDKAASSKLKLQGEELEYLSEERTRLGDRLRDTEARAAELREELNRERGRSAEHEASVTRVRAELSRLEAQLSASQARVRELEERARPRNDGAAQQLERKLHPEAL